MKPGTSTKSSEMNSNGFTLVELMIVIAIIAIIMTLALPLYSNYTIRGKMAEAIDIAAAAQINVETACKADMTMTGLSNARVAYAFEPSPWVAGISVSGDCKAPVITLTTQNTGAPSEPRITLTGTMPPEGREFSWTCSSDAPKYQLPGECRG